MSAPYRLLVVAVVAWWSVGIAAAPSQGAPTYTVSLTASPTALETGEYTTLVTTTNQDLTGTRWTTYLFDQTDPSWYRTCKQQSCSFQVTQSAPGTHTYIAYVARERDDPRYPPLQIQATSNTVTVTWSAPVFTVQLTADDDWVPPGSTTVLTAVANKDMDGRPFAIQIFDLTGGERIASCTVGNTCSVFVSQVSPTTRAYQAYVAEPGTTPPPPNVQARSDVVPVTWSLLPDPTRPPNVGGGPVTGTVVFSGTGVPPLNAQACAATQFAFDGTSESAWVNGSVTAYVGPLAISAEGGSECETASSGGGALVVTASGVSPVGSLSCGPLSGEFTRLASDVTIVVTGDCTINNVEAIRINFIAKGEFVPTNDGGGVTEPITSASFAGAFSVVPS